MNKFIRRTRAISIIIIFVITGLTFVTFCFPMKRELESSYLYNFKLLSESKIQHMQNSIDRSIEGANTISSRTAIKNKVIEYKNGDVSLDELRQFTKSSSKYEEGSRILSNIIGSVRVVDDKIIAEYGNISLKKIEKLKGNPPFLYDLELKDDVLQLTVYSKILNNDRILGYDIVTFDMTSYLDEIVDEKNKIKFLQKGDLDSISKDKIILKDNKSMKLESDKHIGYLYKIPETDDYIYIYTLKSLLYEPARRVINISYTAFLLSLIGFMVILNFIVLKNANKILYAVELSRDQYKNEAYKDSLTNVYSRTFLNDWVEDVFKISKSTSNFYSIAMIDGDNFKKVNDNYGHSMGDKVLIKVAKSLQESVRKNDIVIRYGGDEFLIIFENCHSDIAHSVLKRVNDRLSEDNEFEFNVEISYGIYELNNKEDFYESISKADKKMYNFKQVKKTYS